MSYKETINGIKPIPYNKYQSISSHEKLAIVAAQFLENNKIPLTFTYLCISAFKLFPDRFCFDSEFTEYPHIEKLNRTILHMVTQKGKQYLVGDVRKGYQITPLGHEISRQVSADIDSATEKTSTERPIIDIHKKGTLQDYKKLIRSSGFKSFQKSGSVGMDFLWDYFQVVPFTETMQIIETIKNIHNYSRDINDKACFEFTKKILGLISENQ